MHFQIRNLDKKYHDFLREYAVKNLGSTSRTKAILHIIDNAMLGQNPSDFVRINQIDEPAVCDKSKKRIQFSVLERDYQNLAKVAKDTDSSIQHYLRCLVRSVLYGKYELLGFEMEKLGRSNYELHKLGVNINQIAKALNTGHNVELTKTMLETWYEKIEKHTDRVEKILKDNLTRY